MLRVRFKCLTLSQLEKPGRIFIVVGLREFKMDPKWTTQILRMLPSNCSFHNDGQGILTIFYVRNHNVGSTTHLDRNPKSARTSSRNQDAATTSRLDLNLDYNQWNHPLSDIIAEITAAASCCDQDAANIVTYWSSWFESWRQCHTLVRTSPLV